MATDLKTSSHFPHFPNFPPGNKRKLPKLQCTNDLHSLDLATSLQKPEKGSAPHIYIPHPWTLDLGLWTLDVGRWTSRASLTSSASQREALAINPNDQRTKNLLP